MLLCSQSAGLLTLMLQGEQLQSPDGIQLGAGLVERAQGASLTRHEAGLRSAPFLHHCDSLPPVDIEVSAHGLSHSSQTLHGCSGSKHECSWRQEGELLALGWNLAQHPSPFCWRMPQAC